MKSMNRTFVKRLLSLWIIYHLFVIFVMPNAGSFLGRYFGSYLVPYANIFGLNSPWMFFSPNPAAEYTMNITLYPKTPLENASFAEKETDPLAAATTEVASAPPTEIQWPIQKHAILISTPAIRNFYLMHFFIRTPQYIETLLAPWFCKENPNSESVNIYIKIKNPPTLDKARVLNDENLKNSYEEVNYFERTFSCT